MPLALLPFLLAGSAVAGELAVSFVNLGRSPMHAVGEGRAQLDVGAVSALRPRRAKRAQVIERIGVQVTGPQAGPRFARLTAFLASGRGGRRVSLDGVPLTTTPRVVDAAARVGGTSIHVVEIEVAPDEPAGEIAAEITWVVETD